MAYLWIYLVAAVTGLTLTPLVARLAHRLNLLDLPGPRKVHSERTPRVGGVAILLSAGLALAAGILLQNRVALLILTADTRLCAVVGAAGVVFLMGLADDVRGLRAGVKFFLQTSAALVVAAAGYRIQTLHLGAWSVELGMWAWPVTAFWIVSISNAVNLTDGLDGLAGGTALIASGAMAVLAWHFILPISAVTLMAVMGGLTGFLFFNIHPARVFLGDCGALVLGFLLAVASVEAAQHGGALLALGMLAMCLGVPILDVCTSILRRLQQRRSISAADRGHIHHRLLQAGLSHPQAVLVLHLAATVNAALALTMIHAGGLGRAIILTCDAALMLVFFRRTVAIRIGELARALGKARRVRRHRRQVRRAFDDAQLVMALAEDFQQWWMAVTDAAARLGLARVAMSLEARDGQHRSLVWTAENYRPDEDHMQFNVPVRHRRRGPLMSLRVEIATAAGTRLELAGQTAGRFVRLIDEHSVADLPQPAPAGARQRAA